MYKCECGKEYEKSQSLNGHFSHCLIHRKGVPGIKRGAWKLTKEDFIRAGKTLSDNIKSGKTIPSFKGKRHTEEQKKIFSEKRLKFLEENPNSNIPWIEIMNNGKLVKVQGKWEYKVAKWLNDQNIEWSRKKLFYGHRSYTPDFYLNDNTLIEVKGFMRERDLYKMKLFLEVNPSYSILLIERIEYENLDRLNVNDLLELRNRYDLENIDMSKFVTYK